MENKESNTTWVTFDHEDEDELSFSNFSMVENKERSTIHTPRDSISAEDFFEFFTSSELSPHEDFISNDIKFCDKLNEYQKRDYLAMVRSKSSCRPKSFDEYPFLSHEKSEDCLRRNGSISHRFSTSESRKNSTSDVRVVNITSLTSMSASSRRRMFMFGPVKFKPEMELSAIKERQGRGRVPMTMFPAYSDRKKTVNGGGGWVAKGCQWRGMRKSRGRGQLADVLTKPFGCISGGGKTVRVVN